MNLKNHSNKVSKLSKHYQAWGDCDTYLNLIKFCVKEHECDRKSWNTMDLTLTTAPHIIWQAEKNIFCHQPISTDDVVLIEWQQLGQNYFMEEISSYCESNIVHCVYVCHASK